jgi:hypothetical protein
MMVIIMTCNPNYPMVLVGTDKEGPDKEGPERTTVESTTTTATVEATTTVRSGT